MAHPGGGGGKRKRGDRSYTGEFSTDGGFRPSQYRAGSNINDHSSNNNNNNNNSGSNYPRDIQAHQHQQQSSGGISRDLSERGRGGGNIGGGRGGNSAGGGRRGNRSRNGLSRKFSEPIHGQNQQMGQIQQIRQTSHHQQTPSRQQTPQSLSQPHSQVQTPRSQQQQQRPASPRAQLRREPSDTSSPSHPTHAQSAVSLSSAAESTAMITTPSSDMPMPPPAAPQVMSQPSTPVQPSRRVASYVFEHLTDQCLSSWAEGRQHVLATSRRACEGDDTLTLSTIFQEVIQSVLAGRIPATEGGILIKAIVGESSSQDAENPTNSELSSVFLDTLSILTESEAGPNQVLRTFVASTGISPALMRRQLDSSLLQSLGMIRDTFVRMGIRKQTNLLYRQSNYNLLREESEGYSKLLTELFTTSNNEAPSSEVVKDTFERVKAMIGAFDMDVGRVLDVTLDVFAAVLVKQYRFFVKFLRVSSWWPRRCSSAGYNNAGETGLPKWALPESGGWSTTEEDRKIALKANEERDRQFWDRVREVGLPAFFEIGRHRADTGRSVSSDNIAVDNEETRAWIEQTGVTPPRGNRVAAQLLGFKLRFYSSKSRDPNDILPDNLIYLAALLIKIGFISLRDLYPHLWRPDVKMDELKEEKMKEKLAREKAMRPGAGVMNALMTSGALGDDAAPTPRGEAETRTATPVNLPAEEESKQEETKEPQDQKVLLLKSLLAIGALPESLYILGKFPWLLDVYPELPEYVHRIIHHSLSKVYSSVKPPASLDQAKRGKRPAMAEYTAALKGAVRLGDAPQRRVLRWAQLDRDDENDGTSYRYYWDDWSDNIPICQTVDDVFALCNTFLNLSGVKIGRDPALLTKLARIGKESLRADASEMNRSRWQNLCKQILVPALSLTKQNPGVVNEVFDLLSFFPRDVRYNIYAEWYLGQTSRSPDIKSAFDQAKAETKDALKRLSKTNIRPMARTLAKIAFANPGIVINVAITQIEAYENLIEVVVECARYFTYLGYDILTWSLISSLGQKGRSRVQQGGMFTSRWLNSLSSFVGRVFKRYSSIMDPVPILQYVAEQLRQNNSTDLIVLEQLISTMAGIVTDSNFNDAQVQAMAGGELLQSQTMLQLLDKRHESRTTSKRLIKSLTESNLAGQLLVLIAQERLTCIFKAVDEAAAELKLLGNVFDEIHRVLTQYIDLLRSNFTIEEFDSHVPDAPALISQYGLTHEIAFWIVRPSLAHRIRECDEARELQQKEERKEKSVEHSPVGADEDIDMIDEGEMQDNDTEKEAVAQEIIKEGASLAETKTYDPLNMPNTSDSSPWHPVLVDLMEQVKEAIPKSSWEVVGLPFFTSFWQLSLYDLHIPQKQYEDEMEKQKKQVIAISNDRSDLSTAGMQKREKQKKAINDLNDRILAEYKRHLRAYGDVRMRLNREKDYWFADMRGKHNALNIAILEQCLLPRLLLSPTDAFYCFKMLKYLHSSGATCFRTMGLIDQLFNDQRLIAIIFQSTSREADNLGRFLNDVLRDLARWHADKAVYTKEAYGSKRDLPGFAKTVGADGKPTTFLDYEDFRRLLYKWHRLFCAALKTCLDSGEYMHIRNAISVLKAVVQHFPSVNWMGTEMRNLVNNLKSTDPRDDVKIPAASLIGDFNRRESKWVLPQMFHLSDAAPGDKKGQRQAQAPLAEAKPSVSASTEPTPSEPTPTVSSATDGSGGINDAKLDQAEEGEIDPNSSSESARLPSVRSNLSTQTSGNTASAVTASSQGVSSGSVQSRRSDMQSQATRISRIESPGTLSGSSEFIPIHPMNLPLRPDLPRRPSDSDGRGRREQLERHEHERLGRPAEQNRQQRGRMSDRPQEMRRSEQPSRQEPVDQSGRLSPRDGRSARDPNRQPRGRGRGDMSQTDMQEQRTAVGAVEVHQTRLANIQAEEFGASRDRSPYPEGPQRRHDGGRSPRDDRRQRVPRNESPVTEQAHLPERPDRDARRPQPLRHDEPPTGPRANFADKRSADNRQANSNQSYGRLTQDGRFPNRQNEGIERPHDAPSGPRRGGGSMRPPLATGPRNQSPQATQVLHDVPPSGPSHRQNRSISTSDVSNQAVLAQPSDGSNTAGMHPDRLKQVMTPSVDSSQRFPQSAIGLNPPSGPRASARSVRPPPRSNERSRDGNRSQIQHVQQILHSSTQGSVDQNSEGTPIRGRGAQRQPTVNIPDTMTEKRSELFPDDATLARPGDKKDEPPRQFRGGRRGELMDEFSDQRKPPRASSSRTHSSERGDRTSETGRDREKDRDREHDAHRRHDDDHFRPSSRKDDHRERHRNVDRERERPRGRDHDRERDRDRDRDRGRDLPPDGGSRGDQMRRGEPSSGVNREIVGASGRGRRDNFDRNEKRVAPLNEAIVHPLPPGPRPEERTRDRESHRPRDRDRTERERDNVRDRERPRERDRDRNRDRDRDTDPANPPPNGSGNWPRKRNRPSTAMEGGGPEGAGPARYGHDNKRPRRGH